ncbi:hypothetical protein [Lactobacillus delbrueckii]|uniref:hypothetical protein n=1 Tax=Lactobacillus delbrueckii TaxID=1584 RepID=UPI0021691170|nr:hypothetical protein [Lactobacillus delbrueckii]
MEKHESETRIKQMAAVAAAGIGAVSLGAANLPQPVNAATNDVQAWVQPGGLEDGARER